MEQPRLISLILHDIWDISSVKMCNNILALPYFYCVDIHGRHSENRGQIRVSFFYADADADGKFKKSS